MSRWDVIIIGAGVSGLCTGALLAKAGKKVLLLEKADHIAGRAQSTDYKGHVLDNGPHVPTTVGYLEDIFSRVGKPYPELIKLKGSEIYYEGSWQDPAKIFPRSELKAAVKEIAESSYEELGKFDDLSIKDWVSQRSSSEGLHQFFWYLATVICAGNKYETMSASETLVNLKQLLDRWGNLSTFGAIPKGGLRALTEPLAEVIKERGGEIRTRTRVVDVAVEGGRAQGVQIETGNRAITSQVADTEFIEAPVVICTAPLWSLFDTISRDKFPRWYADWIDGMKYKVAQVWTIIAGLDEQLWDENVFRWMPSLPTLGRIGMMYTSIGYSNRSDQWQAHFITQAFWGEMPDLFAANEASTREGIDRFFSTFWEDLKLLFPTLEKHCLWRVNQAGNYSIAQAPGLVGMHRPSLKTPIENLYLVSDTIRESRGSGLQAPALSALLCTNHILAMKH